MAKSTGLVWVLQGYSKKHAKYPILSVFDEFSIYCEPNTGRIPLV